MTFHSDIPKVMLLGVCGVAGAMLSFSGCANGPVPAGSRMMVGAAGAQFYQNGPAQDATLQFDGLPSYPGDIGGPDFQLAKGAMVTMVRRELGFSKIATDSGQVGYVANDQLQLAPAIARAAATEVPRVRVSPPQRRKVAPPVREEQLDLSDIPLPLPI